MGFLDALIASYDQFKEDILPMGYERRDVDWVYEFDPTRCVLSRVNRERGFGRRPVPKTPNDRRSTNKSAALLVDKASYALGISDDISAEGMRKAQDEHKAFVDLLRTALPLKHGAEEESFTPNVHALADTLERPLDSELCRQVKASHLVAFRFAGQPLWPSDHAAARMAWATHLAQRFLQAVDSECIACGRTTRCLRIAPTALTLFRKQVPLVSINELTAFSSCGKTQLENAPICLDCYSKAHGVAQYLLELDPSSVVGRYAAVIARDLSKGGKEPLRNQLAVFWTNVCGDDDRPAGKGLLPDDLSRIPFEELLEPIADASQVQPAQVRSMLQVPHTVDRAPGRLPARFHLAILSPAKGRIVPRDWLECDVEQVRMNVERYDQATRVVSPIGDYTARPPLLAMLAALRAFTSTAKEADERPRLPEVSPECVRRLIRCIYTGTSPPEELLTRAVRCYRNPDPPTDNREQYERQLHRQRSMAAAMKLVLTHDKSEQEQRAMEQLTTEHDERSEYKFRPPYLTGRALAILEMIQQRASSSGIGVNTTLVDKFYASASTAPEAVFGNLIAMATKAHLPKLRRENKEGVRTRSQGDGPVCLGELLTKVCDALNQAGGFPGPLTPKEQAQFALGFYHQRAEFLFAITK